MSQYRIRVGEVADVRPRWWGKSWQVIYAGTLRDGTISVVVQWALGHNSAAYNLYLHGDQEEFRLPVGTGTLLDSTPTELTFRFELHQPKP